MKRLGVKMLKNQIFTKKKVLDMHYITKKPSILFINYHSITNLVFNIIHNDSKLAMILKRVSHIHIIYL